MLGEVNVCWKLTGRPPSRLPSFCNIPYVPPPPGQLIERRRLDSMECGVGMLVFTRKNVRKEKERERGGCVECGGSVACITCVCQSRSFSSGEWPDMQRANPPCPGQSEALSSLPIGQHTSS